jgi:hypothetical protein
MVLMDVLVPVYDVQTVVVWIPLLNVHQVHRLLMPVHPWLRIDAVMASVLFLPSSVPTRLSQSFVHQPDQLHVHQVTVCSLQVSVLSSFHAILRPRKDVVMVLASLLVIVLWSTHAPTVQFVVSVAFAVIPLPGATWSMDAQFPKFAVTMDSVLITVLCALPSHPTAAVSLEFQLHTNAVMDPVLQIKPYVSYPMAAALQHR